LPEIHRGDRRLLLVIVVAALALRIAYIIDVSDSPYFRYPILDPSWYDAKAKGVLAGDLLAAGGSFRVPLYIYYVAGAYFLFGSTYFAPLLLQAILGALTCGLVFVIARRVFGRPADLISGFGLALYGMAIYSDGELQPTTLFIFFMLAAVYFVVNAVEKRRIADALLTGLFLGLAFLTRPDILPFACVLVLVVALAFRAQGGIRIAGVVCSVLLCFMLLLGYRNYAAFGQFYIFSPQGAVNLYIGNASYADGKAAVAPPTRYAYDVAADPTEDSVTLACRQAAIESVGRDLSDRELSRYYVRKTLAEIRDDFPAWLGLILRKSYYFLNSYERSDVRLLPRYIERHSSVLKLPLLTYSMILPLGITGLCVSIWQRKRLAWVLTAGVIAYAVNTVMFFVVWRFRIPAVPFLLMFSGYAVTEVYRAVRGRSWTRTIVIVAFAGALGGLSMSRFWGVRDEEWRAHYLINEAALYLRADRPGEAVRVYREAIDADPANPRSYFYLGKAYATQGLIDESKEMMDKAVRLNPAYRPFAHLALGVALANRGDFRAAASYFEKALEADSNLGLAAFNLGLCMLNLGRPEDAEKAFTRAEILCKDDIGTLVGLARAYIGLGRYEKGLSLAQRALGVDPENAEALYSMGLVLEAEGRYAEALSYFERALRYMPQSLELRQRIHDLRTRQFRR
jgi:tetratricopeptide (TPR) repeat protein